MSFIQFLTLVGAVGLFLYGLKLMSEGLQKIVGDSLRAILAAMTKNKFTGMLTGLLVTTLVQSSSATTVMIVSFVNAGMITLAQALAVIMGANVGTTTTAWLISVLGFQFPVYYWILPIIAISLPFLNSQKSRYNSWGELLMGFSLLFFSVSVLTDTLPDSSTGNTLGFLQVCSSFGYGSVLLFMVIGILLTFLFQASSASFVIAVILFVKGWIPFEMGCALMLGSNIGTCIAPVIASRSAHTLAKRAALSHLLFNLVGAVWLLAIFYYFCDFIIYLSNSMGMGQPMLDGDKSMSLALFHTLFNVVNLLVLLPFTRQIVSLISRIIPEKQKTEEVFTLQYISEGYLSTSGEMALVQVQKESTGYAEEIYKMFSLLKSMLNETNNEERQHEIMERIKNMEEESDRAELEIAQFLNQISPNTLSQSGEQQSRNLYKIVDELESIADSIFHCSVSLYQKSVQRVRFNKDMNANVTKMIDLTEVALVQMVKVLSLNSVPENALNKAYNNEDEINNFRNQMRNAMLDSIDRREVEYLQNTYFMHLMNECEKIGDYIINVISAASEK